MPEENDLQTLQEAGISNVGVLVAAAAAFLREHPLDPAPPVTNALSVQEESFLAKSGAYGWKGGWKGSTATDAAANVAVVAGEYSQMLATALNQREVAKRLEVGTSRIRQRLGDGSLYSLPCRGGKVCPRFQFAEIGGTLPGLEQVLAALSPDAHPVAVQRFFLTVSEDLESPEMARPLSPREWLLAGHSPEPVKLLAMEL